MKARRLAGFFYARHPGRPKTSSTSPQATILHARLKQHLLINCEPCNKGQLRLNTDQKITISLWALFTLAVMYFLALHHFDRSVIHSYVHAGQHWLHGQNLYKHSGTGFIYFPQAAILYTPFSLFNKPTAEIIWRLFSLAVYAYALSRLIKALPESLKVPYHLTISSIIGLALAFASARNGQMNILLMSLMIVGLIQIQQLQAWRAALCFTLGIAFKPTAFVWWLLSFVLYPRLRWPLVIGLLLFITLPFVFQTPSYVHAQYLGCAQMLHEAFQLGVEQHAHWAQLFGLLETFHIDLPQHLETFIRLLAAISTLVCCWYTRKLDARTRFIWIYAFAACYLMLFNPRTENNDYVTLAPTFIYFILESISLGYKRRIIFFIILLVMILGSYKFGSLFTPGYVSWLTPLAAVGFTLFLLRQLWIRAQRKNDTLQHAP